MASEEDKVKFPDGMVEATTVKGSDHIMMADGDTKQTKVISFNDAKDYLNITGELIDPIAPGTEVSPAVIPAGPAGQKRKFEPEPGFYEGFDEVTADTRWYFYWDGSAWSLKDMGELPMQEGVEVIDPNGTNLPTEKAVADYSAKKTDLEAITDPTGDKSGLLKQNFAILKSNGVSTSTTGWVHSDYVPVNANSRVTRIGNNVTNGASPTIAIIAFYDVNKVFLGVIDQVGFPIPATFSFTVGTYFQNAKYVICSSTIAVGLSVMVQTPLQPSAIDGLPDVMAKNPQLFETEDFATTALTGYYDASGNIVAGANWRRTQPIKTSAGQIIKYKGVTAGNAQAIIGWEEDNSVVIIVGTVTNTNEVQYTVPAGVVRVAGSARMTSGDVFQFKMDVAVSTLNSIAIDELSSGKIYKLFMPAISYGAQGDRITFNPKGILAKRGVDVFWNRELGNQEYLSVAPSSTTDIEIELKYRNIFEEIKSAGISTLKVSPNVPVNPTSMHYFLTIGDSTTLGEQASGIKAAWPNECSRRLTGVGTALMTGAESPSPLSLTNISFIGTIGDQPIKCEGRGGWGYNNYLNNESVSGITNAFWNPSTNLFDLDYYLTQNGFTGVNSTGSNLTIFIQLGWNHVYSHTLTQVKLWATSLIGLIHSAKPDAKIKLIGLATPPELIEKQYSGNRNVSLESIMTDAIIPYAELYHDIESENSNTEYVNVSHQFFSDNSYPVAERQRTIRDSQTIPVYTDYVHPNERGYAQIADVIFYNILYNYCR